MTVIPEVKEQVKSNDAPKVVSKTAFFEAGIEKASTGEIEVTLTKQIRDRDGEIVDVNGGLLKNFKKNPVMLWGHRMMDGDVEDVMGSWKNIKKTENAIIANPSFADHPKAQYLKRMVEDGHIRSVSIGFVVNPDGYDLDTRTIKAWELLEASWVNVPANTEATSNVKSFKEIETEFSEKQYKELLNYKEIHPKIKQYRKLFLGSELCDILEYEKTGVELVDLKNLFDLIVSRLSENRKAEVKQESPDYVTRTDAIELMKELVKSGVI